MHSSNALDFEDLLLVSYTLLRDYPHVRRVVNDRYRHILVDEYQDTNVVQVRTFIGYKLEEELWVIELKSYRAIDLWGLFLYVLVVSCFIWSGALKSPDLLLLYPITSLSSPMTNILISALFL